MTYFKEPIIEINKMVTNQNYLLVFCWKFTVRSFFVDYTNKFIIDIAKRSLIPKYLQVQCEPSPRFVCTMRYCACAHMIHRRAPVICGFGIIRRRNSESRMPFDVALMLFLEFNVIKYQTVPVELINNARFSYH